MKDIQCICERCGARWLVKTTNDDVMTAFIPSLCDDCYEKSLEEMDV